MISSAFQALNAMRAYQRALSGTAGRISSQSAAISAVPPADGDAPFAGQSNGYISELRGRDGEGEYSFAEAALELLQIREGYTAQIKVIKEADEMTGKLLNMIG